MEIICTLKPAGKRKTKNKNNNNNKKTLKILFFLKKEKKPDWRVKINPVMHYAKNLSENLIYIFIIWKNLCNLSKSK